MSLLRFQMRRGFFEESKVYFVESFNWILSIVFVYEIIFFNFSVDNVDIFSLIEKIGNMLVYSFMDENKNILIEYLGI